MSSKKERERQEFLIFILVLYVMGFAFLYSNIAVGVILLGLAFFLTMGAFPPFGKAVRTAIAWLVETVQRHAVKSHETAETSPPKTTPTTETIIPESHEIPIAPADSQIKELVDVIRSFQVGKPLSGKGREKKLQHQFSGFLMASKYRDEFKSEVPIGENIIDFEIKRIGIELKYSPDSGEFQRLFSQVEMFANSGILDYVIVVVCAEADRARTIAFRERIQKFDFGKRVLVMTVS